jgi:hypothetical protein
MLPAAETAAGLRERARRARRLADMTMDPEASRKLLELALELEQRAAAEPAAVERPEE